MKDKGRGGVFGCFDDTAVWCYIAPNNIFHSDTITTNSDLPIAKLSAAISTLFGVFVFLSALRDKVGVGCRLGKRHWPKGSVVHRNNIMRSVRYNSWQCGQLLSHLAKAGTTPQSVSTDRFSSSRAMTPIKLQTSVNTASSEDCISSSTINSNAPINSRDISGRIKLHLFFHAEQRYKIPCARSETSHLVADAQ